MVAKAALDHAVGELHRGVHMVGIVQAVEAKLRPLIGRRQIVARERIKMSGGAEHRFVPPSVAGTTLGRRFKSPCPRALSIRATAPPESTT